jgi:hypothetical protein
MSTGRDPNPFQSPGAPQPVVPHPDGNWWIIPYQSGHQRATMSIGLLMVAVLVSVVMAGLTLAAYLSLVPGEHGVYLTTGFGTTAQQAILMANKPDLLLAVVLALAFCMWTHRAARNLPALGGRNLKYTPGWAVGWFFIPLANLMMPYFVASEIWRNSDPMQANVEPQHKNTSPLVSAWWFIYMVTWVVPPAIGAAIGMYAVMPIVARQGSPQDVASAMLHYLPILLMVGIVGHLLKAVAAVLAIFYVRAVDTYQDAKFEQISAQGLAG